MAKKQKSTETTEQQLMVALRIRPIFPDELYKGAGHLAHKVDKKMVVLLDPNAGNTTDVLRAKRAQEKRYVFDYAFDASSTQEEVYKCTTKKLVENVMEGFNGTVFAYGATGAGKTYTMVGTDRDPGVMVRALSDLFQVVKNKSDTTMYNVTMSYLEIYNENIRDLLNPTSGHLDLREDSHGNHQVAGLSEISVKDENAVMKMLVKGNKNRTQEATGANKTSSRSHAMLQVHVKQQDRLRNTVQQIRTGKLYMVDLAGSERASHTRNTGQRLKEGKHINKSLLALGNCINALAVRGAKYINFRDSKLTRLLKEPLCGNCYTVMIAHISPAAVHFDESRNTLVYADRAKNIKNKVRSNIQDVSQHVAQYETIISELRQEIQRLRNMLEGQNNSKPSESCQKTVEGESKRLKDEVIESFNQQMEVRLRIMEIDNSLLSLGTEFGKTVLILNEWEKDKAKQGMKQKDILTGLDQGKENRLIDNDDPEFVRQAWEDIDYVQAEQQRFMALREDAEREYVDCCEKTYKLAEELPGKVSTDEEKEILNLLTRVHELEIQKIEMQADQLIREHELRQRDIMILRFDRQREFCDEIISKQRQLIDALSSGGTEHGKTTRELADLYRIYKLELDQLSNSREAVEKHLVSNPHRTYSVLGLRPLGSSESMVELRRLDDEKMSTKSFHLPPISSRGKLFTPTCSSQGSRVDSGLSLSSYIQSLPSTPGDRLPPLSETDFVSNDDPVKILSRTRNISSLASRRREHSRESFLNGGYRNTSRRSTNSLNPNGETPPASVLGSRRSSSLSTRRESHDRLPNMSKYGVLPPIEHTGKRTKKNVRRLSKISTSDSESTMTDSQRTRLSTKPKGFGEMMGFSLAH